MLKSNLYKTLFNVLVLISLGLSSTSTAFAVRSSHKPLPPVRQLSQQEGNQFLEDFRNLRYDGDYSFQFQLRQMPRRGEDSLYIGTLWGSWNALGPIMRIRLRSIENKTETINLLAQNGPNPQIWIEEGAGYRLLSEKEMFDPLLGDMHYSAFDLMMGYIFWPDFEYEGSKRTKNRPAHMFFMSPPPPFRR